VAVAQLGQHLNLCLELMNTLLGHWVATLDFHLGATIYLSEIHIPKPTFAKQEGLIKIIGGSLNFRK